VTVNKGSDAAMIERSAANEGSRLRCTAVADTKSATMVDDPSYGKSMTASARPADNTD
jgi:hypothetical protein